MKKDTLTVEDILTEQEVKEYHSQWNSFRDKHKNKPYKNKPLSPYEVHSNKPVIGELFQFKDYPIFRSRIFQKRLKEMDPYFITKHYLTPFWHLVHYMIVTEQMYHASMDKIRKHEDFIVRDIIDNLKEIKEPIFWRDKISVELIYQLRAENNKRKIERGHSTFYSDIDNTVKGKLSYSTIVGFRKWIKILNNFKNGDKESLDLLIKQIETQDNHLRRLITPRQNLQTSKEELIIKLKKGNIPEEQLYDFFSLWDKKEKRER